MKKYIAAVFGIFLLSCQSTQKNPDGTITDPALQVSMQSLKTVLSELLPMVMDPQQFNAVGNQKKIDESLQKIKNLSKQVAHSPAVMQADPSLKFISNAFTEDLVRAEESLNLGKRDYARYLLINVTAYCIECHSRTTALTSFNSPELEKTLGSLKPLDRGEYLLAVRQYDKAYLEFENFVKAALVSGQNLFELDRAVRYGMAVSIKFLRDPKKAAELVKLIADSKVAPFYLKQNAKSWQTAIKSWAQEKPGSKQTGVIIAQARELVRKGQQFQMAADRGGDVYFMRALSNLQLVAGRDLKKAEQGEVLFLTGIGYESVQDLSIWSLHENYYESCVRRVPHSEWSAKCYKRLEESVYLGFTGSSGVRVPEDVITRLKELQKLALPE